MASAKRYIVYEFTLIPEIYQIRYLGSKGVFDQARAYY